MSTIEVHVPPSAAPQARGPALATPEFRRDINGLRALAVLAVVLFHFGVPGFGGGFVGVDVFFVISGFLMTRIICAGIDRKAFSYLGFVHARVVRIVPALLALCLALLLVGWVVLLPPDYRMLGTHILYSLLFLSNIEYWMEAGYFDAASHEKPLLHTWSLSVEWQFYLLLPLALMLLARWTPSARARQRAVLALGALSLAACVWFTPSAASATFFLLPTRAWEMLAGGLLALSPAVDRLPRSWRACCEYLGLAAIFVAIFLFDRHSAWPGANALLPVGGAVLVLAAQRASPWSEHPAVQWLGDRSYSIYLWHWPVFVALVYLNLAQAPAAVLAGLAATCVLGMLSYSFVEQPARRALRRTRPRMSVLGLALPALLVAAGSAAVWRLQGVEGRFPAHVEMVAAEARNTHPMRRKCHQLSGVEFSACVHGGDVPKVLLVGDSHAASLLSGLVHAAAPGTAGVMQLTYSGCPFLPSMKLMKRPALPGYDCEAHNQWVARQIAAAAPDVPVVIAGSYGFAAFGPADGGARPMVYFRDRPAAATPAFLREFGEEVTAAACALAATRQVYMVRPIPEMPVDVPKAMSRTMAWGGKANLSYPRERYMQRNGWLWRAQDAARERCGVRIIDPTAVLCDAALCHASGAGRPYYADDDHLSEFGSQSLAPLFAGIHRAPAPQPD